MDDPVPQPPLARHCWVWGDSRGRGEPVAGVILGWHLQPVHSAMASPWLLQVIIQRAPGNLIVEWVSAHRVGPVRDPSPGGPRKGVRHVWVTSEQLPPAAGLLVDWRRGQHGWEAMVAEVRDRSMLATWMPAEQVVPVADDGWASPEAELPSFPKRSRRG